MNNMLRWEKYAPVGIGMEEMFRRLDAFADNRSSYPPYNIVKGIDGSQELQIALARFNKEDIEVAVEKSVLSVSVSKTNEEEHTEYVHRGIAQRTFSRNWELSDDTRVSNISYTNGLLRITLVQEIPEEQKRKVLPIS